MSRQRLFRREYFASRCSTRAAVACLDAGSCHAHPTIGAGLSFPQQPEALALHLQRDLCHDDSLRN